MSRNAPRRPDPGITSTAPASVTPQTPAQEPAAAVAHTPPYLDRGWFVVQWLWPLCFLLLAVSEVGLFVFRKLTK